MLLLPWLLPRDRRSPEGFVFVRDTYILPQVSSRIKGLYSLKYNRTEGSSFPQMKIALMWYHSLKR